MEIIRNLGRIQCQIPYLELALAGSNLDFKHVDSQFALAGKPGTETKIAS